MRGTPRWWLAVAAAMVSGCYRYVPLQTTPERGEQVQIELNDLGRVQLANSVGPEVGRVEGALDSASDSAVVIRVAQVRGEYGGLTKWDGEPVTFRREYIRQVRRRRLSTTRTVLVVAALTTGVVTFVLTRNLLGFGAGGSSPGGGGGSGGTQ